MNTYEHLWTHNTYERLWTPKNTYERTTSFSQLTFAC